VRPSISISANGSAFDTFLYAAVGDDKNGMLLTVLSALARRNVDPWEEAAELSRLPRETAVKKFVSMLEALPGQSTLADRTAIAERLILLLPNHVDMTSRSETATHPPVQRSPHMSELSLVMIYVALMFVGQWVYFRQAATTPERSAVAAVTPPTVAQPEAPAGQVRPYEER
jgi:hypothetical protein